MFRYLKTPRDTSCFVIYVILRYFTLSKCSEKFLSPAKIVQNVRICCIMWKRFFFKKNKGREIIAVYRLSSDNQLEVCIHTAIYKWITVPERCKSRIRYKYFRKILKRKKIRVSYSIRCRDFWKIFWFFANPKNHPAVKILCTKRVDTVKPIWVLFTAN